MMHEVVGQRGSDLSETGSQPTAPVVNSGMPSSQPVEQKVCPRCMGFVVWERYGFGRLAWQRCVNCGWHGTWVGKHEQVLPTEIEAMIQEVVETRKRTPRTPRGPLKLSGYRFR